MKIFSKKKDKVLFWGGGCDVFSSFSAYQVKYNGVIWPSAEHAYQATKFDNEGIKNKILNAKSAYEAFTIGRDPNNVLKKNWTEIRVRIMEDIVREKLNQYDDIKKSLIETGDREIIEASPIDSFWGWGPDKKGENQLGKIWMKLREEITKGK